MSKSTILPFDIPSTLVTDPYSSKDESYHLEIHNPATGALLTTLATASSAEAETAIAASKAAFQSYRHTTPQQRSQYLLAAAAALEPHLDDLATLLCLENGKPKIDARTMDLSFCVGVFRFFGSLVDKLPGQHYDRGPVVCNVVREPLGVCAAVLPFNWPPIHTGGKLAPALAMGNTVVLKPGDQAPLTALKIAEIVAPCFPKDVLIVLPGKGPEIPALLSEHVDVAAVSFTGSTVAGKKVAQASAKTLKHVALELGGKNAFLVFDDAKLDRAVKNAVDGGFFNKGEACTATSRMIAQKGVGRAVERLKVGDGLDEATHVGPQVSKAQQERVLGFLKLAEEEGAVITAQAQLPADQRLKDGYFVRPTLLRDVKKTMRVAREEMLGPIVTVTPFDIEEEAIEIVNESAYGLTCTVQTESMERAMRCSRLVESGLVYLNNYYRNVLGIPFGGVKDTGGAREHCIETMMEWSSAKTVQMPSGRGTVPIWRAMDNLFDDRSITL